MASICLRFTLSDRLLMMGDHPLSEEVFVERKKVYYFLRHLVFLFDTNKSSGNTLVLPPNIKEKLGLRNRRK